MKKKYLIIGIVGIVVLAFILATSVSPLDKFCSTDTDCVLAYTGLGPCGPCDQSDNELQCVSSIKAEELQNIRKSIGSVAMCKMCPTPQILYRCVCGQNGCEKTTSCSMDSECKTQSLREGYACINSQCKYVGASECERSGGKCYGFGDFVAENCEDHGMITLPYTCNPITVNTQCCSYGE